MTTKRIMPYQRLHNSIVEFCFRLRYAHKVFMWRYAKENLDGSFKIMDLFQRTMAAQQLGYEVVIEASDKEGIEVFYRKKIDVPYEWRS